MLSSIISYVREYDIPDEIIEQHLEEYQVTQYRDLRQIDGRHFINSLKLWGLQIKVSQHEKNIYDMSTQITTLIQVMNMQRASLNDLIIKNADHEKDIERLSDFIECILASDPKLLEYVKKSILKYNHEFITKEMLKKNDLP